MIRKIIIVLLILLSTNAFSQSHYVKLITQFGELKIVLYDDTPLHTQNFLKLVRENFYDSLLFHRIIHNFVIQGGSQDSRKAPSGKQLGFSNPGYTLPAEFNSNYYHKKGALAAPRQPDKFNPNKESNGSQFYIVQGRKYTDVALDEMEQKKIHIKFTDEQRKIYKELGGTPHLDYSYTVFGEVIDGLDIIDKIASVATDKNDRPLSDVYIIIKEIND